MDLKQRKSWYSSTAEAYNKARPHYPRVLIDRVIELTQLPADAIILEIGCGPGTATVTFAELGYSMICLEPNPDFCAIARSNCAKHSQVSIQNISFEEWNLETKRFNAVLAATSIHWISPEVVYPRVASALQDDGSLILLWNVPAIPSHGVHQALQEAYQVHVPSLSQHKGKEVHEAELRAFEQVVIQSGQFKDVIFEQTLWEATYSVDEYLTLLSTFSQYLQLNTGSKNSLFEELRIKINENLGGCLQLLNISAFHIARKK